MPRVQLQQNILIESGGWGRIGSRGLNYSCSECQENIFDLDFLKSNVILEFGKI